MSLQICMEKYDRNVPWVRHVVVFACQNLREHRGDHSWQPLKDADELVQAQTDAAEPEKVRGVAIIQFLEDLDAGKYDPYLENILAVAHERKRGLRGQRTYPSVRSGLTPGGNCRE